ncbi:LIMKAIN B LKAP [Salix purpurea]|uniref:LIMKAIN B LKAP n=1 Tax=Salix purpurea TaxID=77065 RepID=A0A9Q0W875_SALPP|nr:LIMKAIN B LKAP [Salix purpurea]
MLFWAVDNPAPANYLLISGDRDFSNALHQLRMRRYNILLAQPKTASAPLVAAAKSVWLWTSLSAGGRPLAGGELQQPGSKMKEPIDSCSEKPHVANQNSPSTARGDRWGGVQGNQSKTNTPFYPSAPPPMPARRDGTSFTRAAAFGNWSNFGHPASSSRQRRNPGLKHDPKNKPGSKNKKKSKGENSKGYLKSTL